MPSRPGGSDVVSRWSGELVERKALGAGRDRRTGRIDYYAVAVWFRKRQVVERRAGGVSEEAMRA